MAQTKRHMDTGIEGGGVMYIDADTIIKFAALIAAFSTIGALFYKSFKWVDMQKQQETEIASIKKEQCLICFCMLATLDGLKQLGANGNVTDAYQKLEKHLNKTAHEWEEG